MRSVVLPALRGLHLSLTEAEQRVADIVLERPEEVVLWSGRELAKRGRTSETVVFRLVAKLGLAGFKDFKLALLRDEVAEKARAEMGIFNVPFHAGSPLPVQIQSVMEAYAANLQETARMLVGQPLDRVADALDGASIVTLLGLGASLSVGGLAENVLARVGVRCRLSPDSHMQLLQMLEEAERHVVLAFSYSGETEEVVEALRVARGAGARTIVVTAFSASSIVGEAEIVLQVPVVNPHRYRVGLVDAVLPNLMILDILAILIGSRRDVETIRERVEDTIKLRKLSLRNNRPEGDGR